MKRNTLQHSQEYAPATQSNSKGENMKPKKSTKIVLCNKPPIIPFHKAIIASGDFCYLTGRDTVA